MVIPLFCTANISIKLLQDFITESTRAKNAAIKLWVLCRSPSEPIRGPALGKGQQFWPEIHAALSDCPVIESFTTGFLDAPLEILQAYLRQNPKSEAAEGECPLQIADGVFAVLDSRSIRDGTVAIYDCHWRMPKEYLEELHGEDPDWDEKIEIKEMVEWRLKFLTAGLWALTLMEADVYADFKVGRSMYIDEEGVLQLPFFEHAEHQFPDLKEEEKVPWGPEKSAEEKEKSAWRFVESPWVDLVEEGVIKVHKAI